MKFTHTLRKLYEGQSYARILMNNALRSIPLSGHVVDVGGARNPDYFHYIRVAPGTTIEPVDGLLQQIDFETDRLPQSDASVDAVLMCNILEHIYNHQHVLREGRRILKAGGTLVGFVPFWVGYHPDPHDFFRYTDEALKRMLAEAGFRTVVVERVGRGPVLANFNTIVLSVPRLVRPLLYMVYALIDWLFILARPQSVRRNPLGFIFTASVE